jgi:hypothetical protein
LIGEDAGKPDWKLVKNFLLREGKMSKPQLVQLCKTSIALLSKEVSQLMIDRARAKSMQDQ